MILSLRDMDYFEHSTHEKCAIAFLLSHSTSMSGFAGYGTFYLAEMGVHIRQMKCDEPCGYQHVDAVQAQVRKRLFWLYVIGYV